MRTKIKNIYGVIPVTIYTGNYKCSLGCCFCPEQEGYPKSYLKNADTRRAVHANYDIFQQVDFLKYQIRKLYGDQKPVKLEVILLGGTFSDIPVQDRIALIKQMYDSFNGFTSFDLDEAKISNANCHYRVCILAVETRPDCINIRECEFLLNLGVSKVELGVQSFDDQVLAANNRPYNCKIIYEATELLKQHGFKIGYHMMLNMYGSTFETDKFMLSKMLTTGDIIPDQLKIYPLTLLKSRRLQEKMWKLHENGKWSPYTLEEVLELLKHIKVNLPPFVRLQRIQRQFHSQDYIYEGKNLRQLVRKDMFLEALKCNCIKCQEEQASTLDVDISKVAIKEIRYANDIFLHCSYSNSLVGYLRLHLASSPIIREVKILGNAAPVGGEGNIQSRGIGDKLISLAEKITADLGYNHIRVNASPGVRDYFYKRNFSLNGDLLHKKLQGLN